MTDKNRISITAQGIALMRAMEFEKPESERICSDPLAQKFIDPLFYAFLRPLAPLAERRSPGVMGFMTARCRYLDDCLEERLAGGLRQLVILGAGLDSRAYRIAGLQPGRVRVFEVDLPATQQAKIERVRRALGGTPDHVAYVPIDFNTEGWEKLTSAGYDPRRESLFLWEGVTPYLTAEAVDRTLAFVVRNSPPGSAIVFDYIYRDTLTAKDKRAEIKRMERSKPFTGEGLSFGIDRGRIEEFLRERGFARIVDMTADDLHARYFSGANRNRAVAPAYAIAQAEVARKGS